MNRYIIVVILCDVIFLASIALFSHDVKSFCITSL
jgi:hypothetical protein